MMNIIAIINFLFRTFYFLFLKGTFNMNFNWTVIASGASAISAIASLVSIWINFYWNKKMYKANMVTKPKLENLNALKRLIPNYIAEVSFTTYLFFKATANQRDKMLDKSHGKTYGAIYGNIDFEDHDRQMKRAKALHEQLVALLKLQDNQLLLKDVQDIWNLLGVRKEYNQQSTNLYLSDKEKKYNDKMNQLTSKLNNDFIIFYKQNIDKI